MSVIFEFENNYNFVKKQKYVKVADFTGEPKKWEIGESILKILFGQEYWNLRKPELIISVTGGAKLSLKHSLKESFGKGLVKVATNTSKITE